MAKLTYIKFNLNCEPELPILRHGLPGMFFALMPYFAENADGYCVMVNKPRREQLASQLGISYGRVEHILTELVKSGVLYRTHTCCYQVNSSLFIK